MRYHQFELDEALAAARKPYANKILELEHTIRILQENLGTANETISELREELGRQTTTTTSASSHPQMIVNFPIHAPDLHILRCYLGQNASPDSWQARMIRDLDAALEDATRNRHYTPLREDSLPGPGPYQHPMDNVT